MKRVLPAPAKPAPAPAKPAPAPAKPAPASAKPAPTPASRFGVLSATPPAVLTSEEAAVYTLVFSSNAAGISRLDYPHVITYCRLAVLLEKETSLLSDEGLVLEKGKGNPRRDGVIAMSSQLRQLSKHFAGLDAAREVNPYEDLEG